MEKSEKAQLWVTGVIAIATVIYTAVTLTMLVELKASNDLLREEHRLTLRPYVDIEFLGVGYENVKEPEEKWRIVSVWKNNGQLPAAEMRVYTWIDYHSGIVVESTPEDLNTYSLSPHGGSTTTKQLVTKQEALNMISEHGNCYLHSIVWYADPGGRQFTSKYSYQLDYEEGKRMDWMTTFVEVI